MTIAIDIRALLSPHQTGVGEFTSGMLLGLLAHTDHTYVFYYNAAKFREVPNILMHVDDVYQTRYPNKLLTLLSPYLNRPTIESCVGSPIDLIYSPNIQYIAHHKKTPHILTIHDLSFIHMPEYFTKKQRAWHTLQRLEHQAAAASAIIVPSESTKADVVHTFGVSDEKVHVIYPGIAPSASEHVSPDMQKRVQTTYHIHSPYIFYLGTIEPRKNVDTLIEAYQTGNFYKKGIELIIAGAPGWHSEQTLATIEATAGVRYIGYVAAEHKAALYAGAKAFVYPSIFEGFGFPVLEAMAQGTPVVTSNRTSLPEITEGAVRYVDPYRIDSLVHAINESIDTPRTETYKTIAGGYTWERAANHLNDIFNTYGT